MSNVVFAIVDYLSERVATDGKLATVNAYMQNFKQWSSLAPDFAQQLCIKAVWWRSVCNKKVPKGLFVKAMHRSIRWIPRRRSSENDDVSLEYITQKAESFTHLQKNKSRGDKPDTVNKEEQRTKKRRKQGKHHWADV